MTLIQIKVHKKNIRTKLEITEACSEPCQTPKMKLFMKILNGFQLLLSLLSKVFYTNAYSESNRTSKMELFAKIVNSFLLLTASLIFDWVLNS